MGIPEQLGDFLTAVGLWALPVLAAVVFHEVAHGFVALRLGDDTAARMGRLTLNPLRHIHPVGTIVVPAMLLMVGAPVFGWARPVPVDFRRLRDPRRGMVLVALAGPLANLVLAAVSAVIFHQLLMYLGDVQRAQGNVESGPLVLLAVVAQRSVVINVVLAVFNLLPIPPLDGGRVLSGLLPDTSARAVAAVEPFGFLILVVLLTTRSLGSVLETPVRLLLDVLL